MGTSVLIQNYLDNGMFRFESIPTNNKCGVPSVVHKRRERRKLTKDDYSLRAEALFLSSALLGCLHTAVGMRHSSRLEYGAKLCQPLLRSL